MGKKSNEAMITIEMNNVLQKQKVLKQNVIFQTLRVLFNRPFSTGCPNKLYGTYETNF